MLIARTTRTAAAAALTVIAACGGGDVAPTTPTSPRAPTGIVAVSSAGLPPGANADLLLTGPLPATSVTRAVSDGASVNDIPSGRYSVTVKPVRTALGTFTGNPASLEIFVPSAAPVQVTATYQPAPSAFLVSVSGLPANTGAAISITPPGGSATVVSPGSPLVAAQQVGVPTTGERWQLAAAPVTAQGARFAPSRSSMDTTVSFGDTARVALEYRVATGSIAVAMGGLPSGVAGNVKLLGPGSDTALRTIAGATTITGLEPGRYRVVSSPVVQQGITYRPATDTLSVDVVASLVAAPAQVNYAAQVGRLVLQAGGLPAGTNPSLRVVGNGIDRSFTSGGIVDSLPVGSYTVSALAVLAGVDRWAPSPAAQGVSITTGTISAASFTYALASGSLAVTFTGLPAGLAGDVRVTGPNGYTRTITASETVRGLEPGRYTLTPRVVRNAVEAYGVQSGARTVDVLAGATPAAASFAWVLVPTVVDVPVSGLPGGTSAAIQLTDPSGANYNVTGSFRVVPAAAGRWRQTASVVNTGTASYAPTPVSRDQSVLPGDTLAFGVQYTITTGSLAVAVTGLPNGATGNVTVTGPAGYTRTLTATTTLVLLTPGTYTVSAASVSTTAGSYTPSPATQSVNVAASPVAAGATVNYSSAGGAIAISASGVPAGATPVFTLSGPGGAARTQVGAGTVSGLAAGNWTVSAASVTAGGTSYAASPSSTTTVVTTGTTNFVSFTYATATAGTNYTISHVYLTQAIQTLDNSVALVAGRDALLRVFVTANEANAARPSVRVRVYDGGTLLSTNTITAPETSVRTAIAEGTLGSTWNLLVPAANVRPGLRVLVELDPAQAVSDATRSDNTWPASGTPQAVTVNSVPTFTVRFVPVVTGNDTGRVSAANRESFLVTTRRIFPLQSIVSDVRAPFTSSADTLKSDDADGKWLTVLSELNALRTTDGAPASTHYYGVIRVRYTSGIAGYGYVPGRTAVGWDYLPSGDNVAAHEWGHNFSRSHAPCGTTGDDAYPYNGGVIGGFGWNSGTNSIVPSTATDIMSYCSNNWISDYTWTGVMNHRSAAGYAAPAASATSGDGLLVWGRVIDGRIELEPAFRVNAPVTPAPRGATHQVELLDDAGAALATQPLEASTVDHVSPGREHRQFAVVLPWSATLEQRLQGIRVRDVRVPMRAAVQRATAAGTGEPRVMGGQPAPGDPVAVVERTARAVRVEWANAAYRMAMVRDAATGQLMGFVRRSGAAVATGGRAVDVVFSDGVRSVVRR